MPAVPASGRRGVAMMFIMVSCRILKCESPRPWGYRGPTGIQLEERFVFIHRNGRAGRGKAGYPFIPVQAVGLVGCDNGHAGRQLGRNAASVASMPARTSSTGCRSRR